MIETIIRAYKKFRHAYHIVFVTFTKYFGIVVMAFAVFGLLDYFASVLGVPVGNMPVWAPLFILAYGLAGFLIHKVASRELRRQKKKKVG